MASDVRPQNILRLHIWIYFLSSLSSAFYIPGYSIRSYKQDENIPLLVNKIYSDNTQLQFAYFDLPFVCPPSGSKHHDSNWASGQSLSLNLGEVLRGDRIKNSDLDVNMGQDVECAYLCDRTIDGHDIKWAQELIEEGYVTEWILDNLPGATSFVTVDRKRKYYAAGFKLGYKDYDRVTGKPTYFLNNHFTIVVRWRKAPGSDGDHGGKVVTGFEVYTKSVDRGQRNETGCPIADDTLESVNPLPLYIAPNTTDLAEQYPDSSYIPEAKVDLIRVSLTIPYSYSVYFREERQIEWVNRWDLYFNDQAESTSTHWLAIVNSTIISSVLGAVCIIIWTRTTSGDMKGRGDGILEEARLRPKRRAEKKTFALLEKDGQEIDEDSDDEPPEDVSGWKLLHADVFRPPAYAGLLAPLVGSGSQLVFVVIGLLSLSCLGVLNPSWRGGFTTVGILLFLFAGGFSGYLSARLYKTLGGQNYCKNALMTALLFPGLLFSLVFFLNLFTWAQASSTAIPFTTLLALAFLWLLIQLPLVHLGSYYGFYRCKAYPHPTRTSSIPRQIPSYMSDNATAVTPWARLTRHHNILPLLAGLIPFAVLFIELLFVFKSLYLDKSSYYYVFGFLTIIALLLAITISETVIIVLYVQLCAEDYNWWWTSFITGGSSALWVWCYLNWYYWTTLHIDGFVSSLLFFSYGALACGVFGLAGGAIGFLVGYGFVRRIYGAVKVD